MSSPRRRTAARRRSQPTGSPTSEPVFILAGTLRRPHGLRSEVIVKVETDFPERLVKGVALFLGESHIALTIRSRRESSEGLLLSFEELTDRESLEPYRNEPLFTLAANIPPLDPGHFYQHQLIGLDVVEENGNFLGKLVQILDTTANDVYVVKNTDSKEILLPATSEVIRKVDLENKKIFIKLIPGLLLEGEEK